MVGETPREEQQVPDQEGQPEMGGQQVPVPKRRPATPEEMANIAFSGEGEKLETLEPKPAEVKEDEAEKAEKPFDYEGEKTAIEAHWLSRVEKLGKLFEDMQVDKDEFFKKFNLLSTQEVNRKRARAGTIEANKTFTDEEKRVLEFGEKINNRKNEINTERDDALAIINEKKRVQEEKFHTDRLKSIDEI